MQLMEAFCLNSPSLTQDNVKGNGLEPCVMQAQPEAIVNYCGSIVHINLQRCMEDRETQKTL